MKYCVCELVRHNEAVVNQLAKREGDGEGKNTEHFWILCELCHDRAEELSYQCAWHVELPLLVSNKSQRKEWQVNRGTEVKKKVEEIGRLRQKE